MSDAVANLRTDILIVGAGPTGLTLENLLGKSGIRTIIVERNSSPVDEPRAAKLPLCHVRALAVGDPDGPDRRGAARDGGEYRAGDERLSRGDSRTALRALWHGVSGVHGGAGVGESEGGRELS